MRQKLKIHQLACFSIHPSQRLNSKGKKHQQTPGLQGKRDKENFSSHERRTANPSSYIQQTQPGADSG